MALFKKEMYFQRNLKTDAQFFEICYPAIQIVI